MSENETTDENTYQITMTESDLWELAFGVDNRDKLIELRKVALMKFLHDGLVELDFKKNDGTVRTMRCTLNEEVRPEYQSTSGKSKTPNPDQIRVWDLDKQEWRSFNIRSIYPSTVYHERFD